MESIRSQIADFIKENWNMTVSEIIFFSDFCQIKAYDSSGAFSFVAEIDGDYKHIRDIWMQ